MTAMHELPIEEDGERIRLTLPGGLAEHLDPDDDGSVTAVPTRGGVLLRAPPSARAELSIHGLSIFYGLWAKSVQTLHELGRWRR